MATGKFGKRGIRDRAIGHSAGIRPFKHDLVYASTTAYLAAKSARGENSSSAEQGDYFYNSAADALLVYDGSNWVSQSPDSKDVNIVGSHVVPSCSIKAGGAASGANTTLTHVALGGGHPGMVVYNTGTNTTRIAPQAVVDANCTDGMELPSTNTDNVGGTITFGGALPDLLAKTGSKTCFTVGTDPAFYLECKLGIPDVSDYDVLGVGFVEPAAAYVSAIDTTAELVAAYDEKAMLALRDNAGDIGSFTSLAGVDVNTDLTTTDWVDDAVKTLRIDVSSAGAVTYQLGGAAITGAVAFSFADTTVVTPCVVFAKAAAVADTPPIIEYIKWGHTHA